MSKAINKALKAVRMTQSWRGEDFDVVSGARSSVGSYAKRFTARRVRKLSKLLAREDFEC